MKSAVRFSVGHYQFVIDVALVQEVLPADGTILSGDHRSWRDCNLPVLHLARVFGLNSNEQQPMVISNSHQDSDNMFFLVAEKVHGLVDLEVENRSSLPTTLAGIRRMVEGVWRLDETGVLLLEMRSPVTSWFGAGNAREQE